MGKGISSQREINNHDHFSPISILIYKYTLEICFVERMMKRLNDRSKCSLVLNFREHFPNAHNRLPLSIPELQLEIKDNGKIDKKSEKLSRDQIWSGTFPAIASSKPPASAREGAEAMSVKTILAQFIRILDDGE